jgi:hypothetical protein
VPEFAGRDAQGGRGDILNLTEPCLLAERCREAEYSAERTRPVGNARLLV